MTGKDSEGSRDREGGGLRADPVVVEVREEAEGDLEDALALAGTPGGGRMALWHAGQAAEKFLRALARSVGRETPLMWDVTRVFDAVRDLPSAKDLDGHIEVIGNALRASDASLRAETLAAVLEAVRAIRRSVISGFGEQVPPDEPLVMPSFPADDGSREGRTKGPPSERRPVTGPGGFRTSEGRSDAERRTSYVRVFLMCERCGVRIPRTQTTAHGRVPCPLCGRAMSRSS